MDSSIDKCSQCDLFLQKHLIRMKATLGNAEAERLIGTLGELLEVTLKPSEVEALELERQLLTSGSKVHSEYSNRIN